MKNINKELFSLILIVTSGLLILGLAISMYFFVDMLLGKRFGILCVLTYLLIFTTLVIIGKRTNHPFTDLIKRICYIPLTLINQFLSVAMPYFILQIHLLIYLFFSAIIPIVLYRMDRLTGLLELKITTHVYLIVTFSVITATLLNKQMRYLTFQCSPLQLLSTRLAKRMEFQQLTAYFLSEHTIKFVIYFSYFLYLLIFNLFTFEEHSLYSSPSIDKAVLQSFITFLALERLISNLKDLKFKPSEMLKLLLNSMSSHPSDSHQNKDTANPRRTMS